ncbi:MAG TPA: hypothetical protein VGJ00_05335 [Rhabdochlamydiaceae bacterium]
MAYEKTIPNQLTCHATLYLGFAENFSSSLASCYHDIGLRQTDDCDRRFIISFRS